MICIVRDYHIILAAINAHVRVAVSLALSLLLRRGITT